MSGSLGAMRSILNSVIDAKVIEHVETIASLAFSTMGLSKETLMVSARVFLTVPIN
jgi:hypothetical protein